MFDKRAPSGFSTKLIQSYGLSHQQTALWCCSAENSARFREFHDFVRVAGGVGEVDGERVRGLAWFSRSWLDRLGLDATKCAIIRVRGESMEPALPDGCSIMFDRSRQDRREHGIYVVRTNGGLIVKRAVKSGRGWELVSENPAVAPEPWPADAEVVGEVVWVAQTLVGPRRR